jgi:hypothetical protein
MHIYMRVYRNRKLIYIYIYKIFQFRIYVQLPIKFCPSKLSISLGQEKFSLILQREGGECIDIKEGGKEREREKERRERRAVRNVSINRRKWFSQVRWLYCRPYAIKLPTFHQRRVPESIATALHFHSLAFSKYSSYLKYLDFLLPFPHLSDSSFSLSFLFL